MLKTKFKNSKELLKVLNTAENILKKNKNETILQYIKLEKVNDKLCIIARNPYMRLGYYVEDTISIEGDSALYEYKTLIGLLNVLEDEIEINDNKIQNKKCKYSLPIKSCDGYPKDVFPDIVNRKEIDTKSFIDGLNSVFCAISKNEYENVLSGVYVNNNQIVACDSNRVHIRNLDVDFGRVILSKELVNELLKLPFQEKIYMSIFGGNVIFEDENLYIASNFINGKYPKYEMMLPQKIKNEMLINKNQLESALNLLLPVIDTETMNCELEFTNGNLLIEVNNGNKKAKTNINIENIALDKIKVKFNAKYLLDMLKANKEEIVINTFEDNIGFRFKSEDAMQFIMPMIN